MSKRFELLKQADAILSQSGSSIARKRGRKPDRLRVAVNWLRRYLNLSSGPNGVPANRVYAAAARRKISKRTLERAKKRIGWKSYRGPGPRLLRSEPIWFWYDPQRHTPPEKPYSTLEEVEVLVRNGAAIRDDFGDVDVD